MKEFGVFLVITFVVSGLIAGGSRALHKVLGYSNRYIGGHSEDWTDIGFMPLLILKAGISGLIGGMIAFEVLAFEEQYTTIIAGVLIGGGLICIHSATVRFLASVHQFNCGLVGTGIGLFLGGIIGVITNVIGVGIFHNEFLGIILFMVSLVGGSILGGVFGVRNGQLLFGKLAAEVAAITVLCVFFGGFVGMFEAEIWTAVIGIFFGAFLGEILGGGAVAILTLETILSSLIFIGISSLLILVRFKTVICSSCLRYTQPLKSHYRIGIRYCEHCHTEVEQTHEPGKVIFLFGQFNKFQEQKLHSDDAKRRFIFFNPTFGDARQKTENGLFFRSKVDLDREEHPVDVSEVYIDTNTSDQRLLERFITYIVNYPPKGGIDSVQIFYRGELEELGENLKNALRNNFR